MKPGRQFPALSELRLPERTLIDPAILDRPVDQCVEVEGAPSWLLIAAAACGTAAVIVATWSGVLFG